MSKNEQLLDDLAYLESAGMTVDQLRLLHHWSGRPGSEERVTFSSARNYFARGHEMGPNNSLFAERVHFVAEAHKSDISKLVDLAIRTLVGNDVGPA